MCEDARVGKNAEISTSPSLGLTGLSLALFVFSSSLFLFIFAYLPITWTLACVASCVCTIFPLARPSLLSIRLIDQQFLLGSARITYTILQTTRIFPLLFLSFSFLFLQFSLSLPLCVP